MAQRKALQSMHKSAACMCLVHQAGIDCGALFGITVTDMVRASFGIDHAWYAQSLGLMQAGLKAAYINRDGTPYPGFFAQPDAEFTSFEKLADALCD